MHKSIKVRIINALFMQSDFRRTSIWNFWIRRNGIDFSETDPMATLVSISNNQWYSINNSIEHSFFQKLWINLKLFIIEKVFVTFMLNNITISLISSFHIVCICSVKNFKTVFINLFNWIFICSMNSQS